MENVHRSAARFWSPRLVLTLLAAQGAGLLCHFLLRELLLRELPTLCALRSTEARAIHHQLVKTYDSGPISPVWTN